MSQPSAVTLPPSLLQKQELVHQAYITSPKRPDVRMIAGKYGVQHETISHWAREGKWLQEWNDRRNLAHMGLLERVGLTSKNELYETGLKAVKNHIEDYHKQSEILKDKDSKAKSDNLNDLKKAEELAKWLFNELGL